MARFGLKTAVFDVLLLVGDSDAISNPGAATLSRGVALHFKPTKLQLHCFAPLQSVLNLFEHRRHYRLSFIAA
jgi:hypothetical protein